MKCGDLCVVRRRNQEAGTSMIEYALLVALVSFVCVVAMRRVGTAAKQDLNDVRIEIANAGNDGQTP